MDIKLNVAMAFWLASFYLSHDLNPKSINTILTINNYNESKFKEQEIQN